MEWVPKDWLRCNSCFILMRQCKVPFSLSFCGHIFCSKCVKAAAKKCPQCHTQNIRTMQLEEPLNPEIKHCFESTDNLFEKLAQATQFQNQQFTLNCHRLYNLEKKYLHVKTEYHRIIDDNKILQEQIRKMQIETESLKRNISNMQNSTVMMTPNSNVLSLRGNCQSISSLNMSNEDNSELNFYHRSKLAPTKLDKMDFNEEFRVPTMMKVPRSVGGFSISSRGTLFSNFT